MSARVRSKLIISASHQAKSLLRNDIVIPNQEIDRALYGEILTLKNRLLKERRKRKRGKYYDLMVVQYFNDMYICLKEMHRVLSSNGVATMVIADSAPYGVHIPTDVLIGKIALDVGFSSYNVSVIKERGNKWISIKGNRTHDLKLRESIVTFNM